ncbi:MAG: hypothetical protein ABIQ35_01420 [Verrucomicrobiota bacterium]
MSLINDALRRSDQAKKNPGVEPAGGAPMQPVHQGRASDSSSPAPMLFVIIGLIVILAGWFFFKGCNAQGPLQNMTTQAPVSSNPIGKPVSMPLPPAREVVAGPGLPENNRTRTAITETTNASATNAALGGEPVIAVAPPAPPALKLQGIFFRVKNPSAMINGKLLMVGESVAGARVTKIGKEEVTMERDGQPIVLTLP